MNNQDKSAFPLNGGIQPKDGEGLTKRELFDAMAMQGLCSNSLLRGYQPKAIATLSLEITDALLQALDHKEEQSNG